MNYVATITSWCGDQILAMGNIEPNQYTIQNMIDERLNALCKQELEKKIKNIMLIKEDEKVQGANKDYIIKYTISYQKIAGKSICTTENWYFNFSGSFSGDTNNPLFIKG